MDWYRLPLNGSHVIAPLTPAEARRLGGRPIGAPAPAELAGRLGGMIRDLTAPAAPQGEAEDLSDEARRGSPISASPSGAPGVIR